MVALQQQLLSARSPLYSATELSALCLNGEIYGLAGSFVPIDTPPFFNTRLQVAVPALPDGAVLDRLSAAWVYGALIRAPKAHFSARQGFRLKAENYPEASVTNRIVQDYEFINHAGIRLTNPRRTIQDLVFLAMSPDTRGESFVSLRHAIQAMVQVFECESMYEDQKMMNTPKNSSRARARLFLEHIRAQAPEVPAVILHEVQLSRITLGL
ncbi:MAG: hypothetical protein WBA28_00185 [Microbacteriaceae bacterium]